MSIVPIELERLMKVQPQIMVLVMGIGAVFLAACSGTIGPTPTSIIGETSTPAVQEQASTTAEPLAPPTYSWEFTEVDSNGSKPSIAINSDGTPSIAYLLEDMPGFVKYASLGSNGWEVSTVSTGYFYGPLDIRIDVNDIPHITWHNHDTENEAYAVLSDGEWRVQDIDDPGHDGWDNNVAIDLSGRPHTVSIDPSQFGSQSGVEYATLEGDTWNVEEIGSGPIPYEFGTGIALDELDRPHVVWYDDSNGELKYAIKDGSDWKISTIDSDGDVGRFPSIAIDNQGLPAVSYYESLSRTTGRIKFARFDGSAWLVEAVGALDNVFLGHFGARKTSSLVIDGADNPVVVYSDEEVVNLAWFDGTRWQIEPVLTSQGTPFGQQVSVALDDFGTLHLTFADVDHKGNPGVTGAITYGRGTPHSQK